MSGGRSRLLLGGVAIAAAVSLLALVTPSADSAATPLSALTQPSTVAIVPTSTATATNQRPRARLYVQGDSLTVGTLEECDNPCLPLATAQRGMRLSPAPNARVGRSVSEGLAVMAHTSALPARVLIALGTNDWEAGSSAAGSWVKQARLIVGPSADIFWVNLAMEGHRYRRFPEINSGLVSGSTADNVRQARRGARGRSYVLDWASYATTHHLHPGSDGVHYSSAIYSLRARFYAGAVAGSAEYLPYRIPQRRSSAARTSITPLPAPIRLRHPPGVPPLGLAMRMTP